MDSVSSKHKVLLAAPMEDGQTFPGIKFAFEKLGWEVYSVDAKLIPHSTYERFVAIKPDLVICSRTLELTESVELIKKNYPESVVVVYQTDKRPALWYWEPLFDLFSAADILFDQTPGQNAEWRDKINKNTIELQQALQSEVYHIPDDISIGEIERHRCDVSFVGTYPSSFHTYRNDVISCLQAGNVDLRIYTNAWNNELNLINNMHVSKICLDIGVMPNIKHHLSVRIHKILGACGFALVKNAVGLMEIYPPEIFAIYNDEYECLDKVRYYLENPTKRYAIALKGYNWVQTQTYFHRMQEMLEEIKKIRGEEWLT